MKTDPRPAKFTPGATDPAKRPRRRAGFRWEAGDMVNGSDASNRKETRNNNPPLKPRLTGTFYAVREMRSADSHIVSRWSNQPSWLQRQNNKRPSRIASLVILGRDKAHPFRGGLLFIHPMKKNSGAAAAVQKENGARELGFIVLSELYDQFSDKPFEQAIASLAGLGTLIQHHPDYRREAKAMRQIDDAERVLNKLRGRRAAL